MAATPAARLDAAGLPGARTPPYSSIEGVHAPGADMQQLSEFYDLMASTVPIRRELVSYYLLDVAKPTRLQALREVRRRLAEAPTDDRGRLRLADRQGREILVQADYEALELDKDLRFFEEGEAAFASYLGELHPRFGEESKELVDFLRRGDGGASPAGASPSQRLHPYDVFVTDRDGTVNNYCARYRSSVQSAYNAVFLSRFGSTFSERPLILTSAPLQELGIRELTVIPENSYVLAGSKGREYRALSGERQAAPLTEEQEAAISELNRRLEELLERPENRVFGLIGSSLQKKHGETTLARQDINESIPPEESERFRQEVEAIVGELNNGTAGESATGQSSAPQFRIEDTGKDLEIMLADGAAPPDGDVATGRFDKGDGVAFLMKSLGRSLEDREVLISGDTASDIPMVSRAMEMGARVTTVFVTSDRDLQQQVQETGARAHFVSTPDVLVTGLDLLAKGYNA